MTTEMTETTAGCRHRTAKSVELNVHTGSGSSVWLDVCQCGAVRVSIERNKWTCSDWWYGEWTMPIDYEQAFKAAHTYGSRKQ